MEVIHKKIIKVIKKERAKALKEIKPLYKELSFSASILKGLLSEELKKQ